MTDPRSDDDREYTRFQSKVQLGDGVDRRGDISVEIVRDRPPLANRSGLREVTLPGGDTVEVTTDDRAFGEFYFELTRSADVLRDVLALDDEP